MGEKIERAVPRPPDERHPGGFGPGDREPRRHPGPRQHRRAHPRGLLDQIDRDARGHGDDPRAAIRPGPPFGIEREGGEVLKYLGDGVLAIFREGGDDLGGAAQSALTAAQTALRRLDEANAAAVDLARKIGPQIPR